MLKIQYSCSTNEAAEMIRQVRSVFEQLPKNIQQKIDAESIIILLGKTYGYTTGKSNKKVIILNFNEMYQDCLSEEEQRFVIAHEFAHFHLNHTSSSEVEEQMANKQAFKWGFNF